jgi:hypothetical protein
VPVTEPLIRLLRRVQRASPRHWPAEAAYRLRRTGVLPARWLADTLRPTYGPEPVTGGLAALAPRLDPGQAHELAPDLADRCARYLEQRFDLLGSGWRTVVHGTRCPGFEGHRYRAPAVRPDPAGAWLAGQVSRPNLAPARAVWRRLGPGYRPVDWHLDFRSGYRWSPLRWYAAVPIGHLPGVDVKVPWELGRAQHLPQLALAFGCARAGLPGFGPAARYREAFRNQVLDFVATNPPRYGVHWRSGMEVAIRMANWLLAQDLFRAYGATWDRGFERVLAASVVAHGRHLAGNPERSPAWRNNHYLANLAGLAFAAAYLPESPETARWGRTAAAGLAAEIDHQFLPDGGHFEASTGYHAFAAELAAYSLAMVAARSRRAVSAAPVARGEAGLPDALEGALGRMAEFLVHLTKPGGRLTQIGDHDSGRLFRLAPRRPAPPDAPARELAEEHLDASPAVAALNGLVGRRDLADWYGGRRLEESLVAGLAGERSRRSPRKARPAGAGAAAFEALRDRLRSAPAMDQWRLVLAAPGASLRTGMEVRTWPDFGATVFRSERLYLCLRAGFGRHDGSGGHAHVDQLAVEVAIDGVDWIRDPGSCVYTPSPRLRNAYRSHAAHFTPYTLEGEGVLWGRGLFQLPLDVRVRAAAAGPDGAAVDLLLAGTRIGHLVMVGEQEILLETHILHRPPAGRLRVRRHPQRTGRLVFGGAALAGEVPFALGYGLREAEGGPRQ